MAKPPHIIQPNKNLSKKSENLIAAFQLGYRVVDGKVFSKTGYKLSTWKSSTGYLEFSCFSGSKKNNTRKTFKIFVHRLVAYQKYGEDLFNHDCVRHLDGNKLNNTPDNILVGTFSENTMDIKKEVRIKKSSLACRKFKDSLIKEIRRFHKNSKSYKKTMNEFNIKSKGSLHYLLNNKYVSKVN